MDENITDALMLGFGVLVFVIAVSLTMYIFSVLNSTSSIIFEDLSRGKSVYSVALHENTDYENISPELKKYSTKKVTKSSIIPVLYNYYKEDMTIKIFDRNKNLKQVFDIGIEGEIRRLASISSTKLSQLTDYERRVKEVFGNPTSELFMFGANWIGSGVLSKGEQSDDARLRVDLFVSGKKSSINGGEVDYTSSGRDWFANLPINSTFTENVIKYNMTGDVTINDSENYGDELVNSAAAKKRIEIIYTEI